MSVESNPHGDVAEPSDGVESDRLCIEWSFQLMKHNCMSVPVARENLKQKGCVMRRLRPGCLQRILLQEILDLFNYDGHID